MEIDAMDMTYKKPVWFSQREDTAKQYGQHVHKVLTTRTMKLINITSPYFQSTWMDFLNEFYRNDKDSYEKKMELLTPIGLPDEPSQDHYLKTIGFHRRYNNQEIYKDVAFFYNHHRFSQKNMDDHFVNFLQLIHKQYGFDGYIAPCIWPTKYHVQFSDEICLFNMSALQYSGFTSYPNQNGGGQLRLVSIPSPKYVEKNTWRNIEILKNSGWTGEYEIDSDGILVNPSPWVLGQFCKANYEKKKREEVALMKKQIKERESQTRLAKKSEVKSPRGASDGVKKSTDRNIKVA
jgi:hypothetical protein